MEKKEKVQKALIKELVKEDWDSNLVEKLIVDFNDNIREERILKMVSDKIPFMAAETCNVTVMDMVSGSRKGEIILALKFCYKELYENHKYTYERLAFRFNRKEHATIMSGIRDLNNRLETNDKETVRLYKKFKRMVGTYKNAISK